MRSAWHKALHTISHQSNVCGYYCHKETGSTLLSAPDPQPFLYQFLLRHPGIKVPRWFLRVFLQSFADGNTIFHVGKTTFTEDKVNEYKCQFVKGAF